MIDISPNTKEASRHHSSLTGFQEWWRFYYLARGVLFACVMPLAAVE